MMTITEALEHSGMTNIKDYGYWWVFEYNGKSYTAQSHEDWNSWKLHFRVVCDGQLIANRCSYRTMIQRIKNSK